MSNGVVIQGPLLTYGQGPNKYSGGFDTFETISKNIEVIEQLGMKHIICTWIPSCERESDIYRKIRAADYDIMLLDIPKCIDPDHRYKHHYAIKQGLDHLTASGVTCIMKIRTDMYIPKSIFLWLAQQTKTSDKFVVSELYNDSMTIGDFIYCAKKEQFGEFLESILFYGNFNIHPSIGVDIGIKYFMNKTGGTYNPWHLPIWLYHLWFTFYKKQKHVPVWQEFVYRNLTAIPRHLWDSIIWRDRPMTEVMNSSLIYFFEDITNQQIPPESQTFQQKLIEYKSSISSYYGKRTNKKLVSALKKIRGALTTEKLCLAEKDKLY